MPITIGTGAGNKVIANVVVGTASGNETVLNAYVGTSGGNKLVYTALSAAAFPNSVTGFRIGAGVATTISTTATATGGLGPFTYSWARTSGDTEISITAASSATTQFTATLGNGDSFSAQFVCTVTDTGTGLTVDTNAVSAVIEEIGGG